MGVLVPFAGAVKAFSGTRHPSAETFGACLGLRCFGISAQIAALFRC